MAIEAVKANVTMKRIGNSKNFFIINSQDIQSAVFESWSLYRQTWASFEGIDPGLKEEVEIAYFVLKYFG
jgi:hypothetical protein